jgi:hypothetical protein
MLDTLHRIYQRAGVAVPVSEDGTTMPWHSLRHTFGTEYAKRGCRSRRFEISWATRTSRRRFAPGQVGLRPGSARERQDRMPLSFFPIRRVRRTFACVPTVVHGDFEWDEAT